MSSKYLLPSKPFKAATRVCPPPPSTYETNRPIVEKSNQSAALLLINHKRVRDSSSGLYYNIPGNRETLQRKILIKHPYCFRSSIDPPQHQPRHSSPLTVVYSPITTGTEETFISQSSSSSQSITFEWSFVPYVSPSLIVQLKVFSGCQGREGNIMVFIWSSKCQAISSH